jgi:TolB-like protein/AraC-like DNA-binding protein/Tfp pilus assembly protein PilF
MPHTIDKESFLNRLTEIIHAQITNEQFGVNELAREVGMSRSNLHRKVKALTGHSVSKFISHVRLDMANRLLKETSNTMSEIAFECGFHSSTYFSKCYKDRFGYPPGEAKNQVNDADNQEDVRQAKGRRRLAKKRISIYYFLATLSILSVAIVLILGKPFNKIDEPAYKSIAVLPFINDSPEESEMYFINGTMESILNNLCKIEDLRVVSRTSVEQYRNRPKPIPVIGKELGVSYILEGSGQKYGKRMHLTVQLLDALNDTHIWSEEYDLEINQIEELFDLQNEIARKVAAEIHAEVSPEEMQRMKKIPTNSEIAYEFYLRGYEEGAKHYMRKGSSDLLSSAESLFRYALEYDPEYAAAYSQIARNYYIRLLTTSSNKAYLDSIKINLDRALQLDPEDALSYELLGIFHRLQGNYEKAIENFKLALEYRPNSRDIYVNMGETYSIKNDFVNALAHLYKARTFPHPQYSHTNMTETFKHVYLWAGCKKKYDDFANMALDHTGDTVNYYCDLAIGEYWIDGNRSKALELLERSYQIDSTSLETLKHLGEVCLNDSQFARSLKYYEKYLVRLNELDRVDLYSTHNIGLAYWLNGDKENAEHFFDLQISYCRDVLSGDRNSHSQLAAICAFKGDRERAIEHLTEINKQTGMRIYAKNGLSEDNLFFASIQDDAEYTSIRAEILAKYQAEHDRVMEWLEENDKL